MRNFLQLVVKVVLLIGCLFYSPEANAATINAASCSRTDVVTAMGQAADGTSTTIGDTVIIPACTTTAWASPIVVTKRITIQGQGTTAGSSLTSLGTNQAFVIKLTTDGPVRITAIAMARSSWGSSDTMVEIIGSNHNGVGTYMSFHIHGV